MSLKTLTIFLAVLCMASMEVFAVGALFVRPLRSNAEFEAMTIRTYDVNVQINDHVAVTHVDQTFFNERNDLVESTLIFPLPAGAVITDMWYHFNGKKYRASVREKAEAQAAYNAKVRRIIDPALLQEIGDNLFKLNIAPINPRSEVRVEIRYTEILDFALGTSHYKHLLKTTGLSPKPLTRMTLQIDARTSSRYDEANSPSFQNSPAHEIVVIDTNRIQVRLGDEGFVPTKNYHLRLIANRNDVEMGTLTYVPVPADSFGVDPFFFSWVIPPSANAQSLPRSVAFVADVSSSMDGNRMDQLREAIEYFLDNLSPVDRFNIVLFSTNVMPFAEKFVDATPDNIEAARQYVRTRTALGLTNISEALRDALHLDFHPETANAVVFLTDGHPSWGEVDAAKILDAVPHWNTSDAVVYPITIGEESSISLMQSIANMTGGFLTQISDEDSIVVLIEDHLRRMSMPNLTDLSIDYGTLESHDVLPVELPNAPVGSRITQSGRYKTGGWYPVTLQGIRQETPFSLTRDVLFGDLTRNNRAVARLWAVAKINALLEQIDLVGEQKELVDAVIDISIRFGILTRYTALYSDPDEDEPEDDNGNTTSVGSEERPIETISIAVAPHPATMGSRISITFNGPVVGDPQVSIVDAFGRTIGVFHAGPLFGNQLDVDLNELSTSLPPGMYTIIVRVGDQTATKNIIVIEGN